MVIIHVYALREPPNIGFLGRRRILLMFFFNCFLCIRLDKSQVQKLSTAQDCPVDRVPTVLVEWKDSC